MGKYILDENALRASLEAAQDELVNLLRERESREWRIRKLYDDIGHLAALLREPIEDPVRQLGLTDAIRYVLSMSKRPLGLQDIINALSTSGYNISSYSNIAANIHTIVKRLIKSKEVKPWSAQGLAGKGLAGLVVWTGGLPPIPPRPGWLEERMKR